MTIRRENHSGLVAVACLLGERERHAAGNRHIGFACAQAFTGQMHGNQRAGAGGLYR